LVFSVFRFKPCDGLKIIFRAQTLNENCKQISFNSKAGVPETVENVPGPQNEQLVFPAFFLQLINYKTQNQLNQPGKVENVPGGQTLHEETPAN
jgi:hypothetical protein